MIEELATVALTRDVPEHGLEAGDLGAVVMIYKDAGGSCEYEVEFVTLDGRTLALLTVPADAIRPVRAREIAHARAVA